MLAAFAAPGEWLKGNLHTHTTESDGVFPPQEMVDMYAGAGYDFLALTDHDRLTPPASLNAQGLVLIPGSEIAGGRGELGQTYHVVVLGLKAPVAYDAAADIQEVVNTARAAGEICFIAHPNWSSLTYRDLLTVEGISGVEVYNTDCHHGCGSGESAVHWDELLVRGRRLWGLAVDDAHWHFPDGLIGWVRVKSPKRTPEAILAALQQGHFYASNGPLIHDLQLADDQVHIACDPAREVRLIAPGPGQGTTTHRLNLTGPFTEVSLPLHPTWEVARVEVIDAAGRVAWSNPWYRA